MTITVPPTKEGFLARAMREAGEFNIATINVPPAEHRLKNIVGLSLGIYVGRELMNLVTARNWDGTVKEKESVPAAFYPLYGIMTYNKYSDEPRDRWMKVFDNTVPAALGAVGAVYGSYDFFSTRSYNALKPIYAKISNGEALTLAEANLAAGMKQGEIWRALSGVSTMLGSSSGTTYIPWPLNFGTALGSSFNKGLGRTMGGKLPKPLAQFISGFTEAIEPAEKILTDELYPKLSTYILKTHRKDFGKLSLDEFVPYMDETVRVALSRHFDHKFQSEEGQRQLAAIVEKLKDPFEKLIAHINARPADALVTEKEIAGMQKWIDSLKVAATKEGLLEHAIWEAGGAKHIKVQQYQGMVETIANALGARKFVERVEGLFAKGLEKVAGKGKDRLETLLSEEFEKAVGRAL